MRKLFGAALIIAAMLTIGIAQNSPISESTDELAKLARAPIQPDGIGRAVVIVSDASGNPVPGARATLESIWGGDHFCESFGSTNRQGAIALPPIRMGTLKLIVKAKGYETLRQDVAVSSLSEPVRVTLVTK